MALKWIALGSRIMGDDSVALIVTDRLQKQLERIGFEVVIGETDIDYVLYCVEEGDHLIVCDVTHFGGEPGTVWMIPLEEAVKHSPREGSLHRWSILPLLPLVLKPIQGYFIGVEVERVELSLEVSHGIQQRLEQILQDVYTYGLTLVRLLR